MIHDYLGYPLSHRLDDWLMSIQNGFSSSRCIVERKDYREMSPFAADDNNGPGRIENIL
jgi:hypothetical protein